MGLKETVGKYEFNLKSVSRLEKWSFHCIIISVEQTNDLKGF